MKHMQTFDQHLERDIAADHAKRIQASHFLYTSSMCQYWVISVQYKTHRCQGFKVPSEDKLGFGHRSLDWKHFVHTLYPLRCISDILTTCFPLMGSLKSFLPFLQCLLNVNNSEFHAVKTYAPKLSNIHVHVVQKCKYFFNVKTNICFSAD